MLKRMPSHYGDETCPSCVVAGDYIFLAHHGGGQDVNDIVHQMRATFEGMSQTLSTVGATLDNIVQIQLYLKNAEDFGAARGVFFEYFKDGFPARMTSTIEFLSNSALCQMTGIAYKPVRGDSYEIGSGIQGGSLSVNEDT